MVRVAVNTIKAVKITKGGNIGIMIIKSTALINWIKVTNQIAFFSRVRECFIYDFIRIT
ncbi:hypothetical protein O185_05005 [Photorhabdus temperata J3]|uniref:Uncharacterized protein n=1 Tax=Photorhabdus temperata J3 TaxID=1389415 RepID=U7R4I4_PHOTE|nr:hypothetical protein O185_05005 [Photorhabdus temperata J3]